jgi:murein DD-endopeptidase MepM/ murein hydrolase activator NlpD
VIGVRTWVLLMISFLLFFTYSTPVTGAEEKEMTKEEILSERMALYLKHETVTLIPWYYIAAVDQFERNIQQVRRDLQKRKGITSFQFSSDKWVGTLNPNPEDTFPETISFFNGKGLDGNNDGEADRNNDEDVLLSLSQYLASYGNTMDDFKIALWHYYGREQSVHQIATMAKIYKHFQTLDLNNRTFPLPSFHNYSYRSTWGDSRGWGGRRIHEGTDLFASYGVPVRSTTYGVIEIMGWNKYGGWRVGIRDIHNVYHYYAHLSGFNDEVKEGDIVEPGTVVGYVGSSGYGKPGTSGKFPPHLHYGMYKDNGRTEWAYDPYPSLRIWERLDRKKRKKNR